eukprot:2503638-Rhodomonas_salina.1
MLEGLENSARYLEDKIRSGIVLGPKVPGLGAALFGCSQYNVFLRPELPWPFRTFVPVVVPPGRWSGVPLGGNYNGTRV